MVYKLDRLGRSLRNLISLIEELEQRGVGFRSLTESIDTTTSGRRLIFQIFGALAAARARGRVGGRKPPLTPQQVKLARELFDNKATNGMTVQDIADAIGGGVSRRTIYRHLQATVEPTAAQPTPTT